MAAEPQPPPCHLCGTWRTDWLTYYTAAGFPRAKSQSSVQLPFCVRLSLEQRKVIVYPRYEEGGEDYDFDTLRPVVELNDFQNVWFGSDYQRDPFDNRKAKQAFMVAYWKFVKEFTSGKRKGKKKGVHGRGAGAGGDKEEKEKNKNEGTEKPPQPRPRFRDLPFQAGEGLSFLVQTKANEYIYIGDCVYTSKPAPRSPPRT